ncbi:cystathionine gamma-synthase [Mayamaea pseudoterrestris]|nr:cystathionine gamma-synthase [Mayamaea pseudoterrestris]
MFKMMRYTSISCCNRLSSISSKRISTSNGLIAWSTQTTTPCTLSSTSNHRILIRTNTSTSSIPTTSCSQPLGTPLPYDEHACSVSLPTWASVVGYEEGDPSVTMEMKCGYPRFVYHPYVLQLMKETLKTHGNENEDCLVLPSEQAAHRCLGFLAKALHGTSVSSSIDNALPHQKANANTTSKQQQHSNIRVVPVSTQVYAVLFPAETVAGVEAKAYWQHTGEVVSSRRAEQALQELGLDVEQQVTSPYTVYHASAIDASRNSAANANASNDTTSRPMEPHNALRTRIAEWAMVPSHENVFLTPSGMSAIYHALRASRRYQLSLSDNHDVDAGHLRRTNSSSNKGGTAIVYGFPYLDTLKMCSRSELVPGGVEFFGRGNKQDLHNLEAMLRKRGLNRNYCALLSEVPSNPLLQCPDLYKLRELADEFNFMLILDDTIANFLNVDLITTGLADAVCTSLTKLASGRGDAMAGSIVANPNTSKGRWLQQDLQQHHNHMDLFQADAAAILFNSIDFRERNATINANAEGLADWLNEHEDVKTVYYPKHVSSSGLYKDLQTANGGFGGLFSMILHSHMCQRTFYDALDVAKGPSLGTDFTLVCPYTLLAHYHELDFAMSYDVAPNLVRVAVGLEPLDDMKQKFASALRQSKLHPKVCMESLEQRRAYSTTTCHAKRCDVVARTSSGNVGARQRCHAAPRTTSFFVR